MSLLSLSTKSIGLPDNAYAWYLHSSGNAIAGGLQVALGDGSATGLWLGTYTIGVCGATGTSVIGTLATTTRAVTLANSSGILFPYLSSTTTADTVNSTVTPATVAGFNVALEASAIYEFDLILVFKSAATTTSPRFTINGPTSQTDYVNFEVNGAMSIITLDTSSLSRAWQQFVAWGVTFANATDMYAANQPLLFRVRGICRTTSTAPAVPVSIDIYSETAAVAITLVAGSTMLFRRIA